MYVCKEVLWIYTFLYVYVCKYCGYIHSSVCMYVSTLCIYILMCVCIYNLLHTCMHACLHACNIEIICQNVKKSFSDEITKNLCENQQTSFGMSAPN